MKRKFVKSLFVLMGLMFIITLSSCDLGKKPIYEPEIKGVKTQVSAYTGDVFDILAGITATDKYGKDATSKIKYFANIPMDDENRLTLAGDYMIKYELVIDDKVVTQVYSTLIVTYRKPADDDRMILNGDFETGSVDPFTFSQFENGNGTMKVLNNELVIDITNIAAAQASPRVEYNDLILDSNKFYEVKFDARANITRWVHVQLGELIPAAPWFKDIDPIERFFHLTTEMQTFSFRFKPSTLFGADMSKISLLFEFGKMKEEAVITSCFLDNIVMNEVDSLGEDTTPPTITAPATFNAYQGEVFNLDVTAFDDFDGDITSRLVISGDEIPVDGNGKLTTQGTYNVIYTVKDNAGNETSVTVVVTVLEPRAFADVNNLFGTPDAEIVFDHAGTGDENHSKLNPLKWHLWHIGDSSWGIGPVTTMTPSYVDGVLTVVTAQNENPNFWANQIFYTTLPFEEGGQFILKLKINSDSAKVIAINGHGVNLAIGDNLVEVNISVASGSAFTLSIQFGTESDGPVGDITLILSDYAIVASDDAQYADVNNLFGTPNEEIVYDLNGNGSEANAKTNPLKWHLWNIADLGWGIGPVTTMNPSYVDGVLTVEVLQNGNPNFWANQIFYTTLPFKDGGEFDLILTVTSNAAGKITICGQDVELVVGENEVELVVGVNSEDIFLFSCAFGTATDGPIGDINLSFKNISMTVRK